MIEKEGSPEWICEYVQIFNDPKDGYLVYLKGSDPKTARYAYYPTGKEQAERFAQLCNDRGEREACKIMNYGEPR